MRDTPVILYVVWEGEEGTPIAERQMVTPAFFTHAEQLDLASNSLLTIVPDHWRAPAATVPPIHAP